MHSAAVVGSAVAQRNDGNSFYGGSMLIFGGHNGGSWGTRTASEGGESRIPYDDEVYDDLWEMLPGKIVNLTVPGGGEDTPIAGTDTIIIKTSTSPTLNAAFGSSHASNMCVVDVNVEVKISFTCRRNLYIDLLGPGHSTRGVRSHVAMEWQRSRGDEHPLTSSNPNFIHNKDIASHTAAVRLLAGHHSVSGTILPRVRICI